MSSTTSPLTVDRALTRQQQRVTAYLPAFVAVHRLQTCAALVQGRRPRTVLCCANRGRKRPQATSGRPSVPSSPGGGGTRSRPRTGGGGGGDDGDGDRSSTPLALVTAIFAVLLLVGGVTGYLKKGSITSLTASSIFGVVYVGAAYLMRTPASAVPGLRIALGASVALGGYMLRGYTKTKKVFPQGVFAGLSLTLALAYISQGLQ